MSSVVTLLINNEPVTAQAGQSLGSLLHSYKKAARRSPKHNTLRSLYCGMGVCFECMTIVNGQPVRACITPIEDGMSIEVAE